METTCPKITMFITVANICIIMLVLIYIFDTYRCIAQLGYGHIAQTCWGYFLIGPSYYKALPDSGDDLDDEAELNLANEQANE